MNREIYHELDLITTDKRDLAQQGLLEGEGCASWTNTYSFTRISGVTGRLAIRFGTMPTYRQGA
jgi:hypothetical protein